MSWPSTSAREHCAGVREQHPDDALRRPADLVVEAEEDAVAVGERRNDDVDGDEGPREAGERDDGSGSHDVRARPRTRFPARRSAAPSAHLSSSRARRRRRTERADRCPGTRCRRGTTGSRTSPDGSLRTRSSRPTGRRGTRAPEALRPIVAEVATAEPEHRERPERHHRDLRERERKRRRPEHPQRREQHEKRIRVTTEAHHLLAGGAVRRLERPALRRTPHRLHHVPEVEPPDRGSSRTHRARGRRALAVHPTIAAAITRSQSEHERARPARPGARLRNRRARHAARAEADGPTACRRRISTAIATSATQVRSSATRWPTSRQSRTASDARFPASRPSRAGRTRRDPSRGCANATTMSSRAK